MILVDGEIYLLSTDKIKFGDHWIYICKHTGKIDVEITKNTLPDGMQWFDKLHDKDCYFNVIASTKQLEGVKLLDRSLFVLNEFTKEDMELAWKAGSVNNTSVGFDNFEIFINSLQPLVLPKSITTNDELDIISVIWT